MSGMIKKDLFMIKNNYKVIFIAFLIYVFYSLQSDSDISFFLIFIGLMACISTFSYDDFNNWHAYGLTMPQGRVGIVKSKYIITIGVILLVSILSILINFLIGSFRENFILKDSLLMVISEIFVTLFMISILFPVLFKYGAEKGRLAMIIIGILIFALIAFFTNTVKLEISESFANFIDSYFGIIGMVTSFLALSVSYFISKKIYLKKEF